MRLSWNAALETQWQPIETVPKYKPVFVVESGVVQKCAFEFNGEYWIISGIDEPMDEEFKPTHWQPLPQPPNDLGDL